MERIRLVKSTEMGKEKSRKISSKQLEAKITAYTILLAVIVMNILWWTGTQFLELNNNHNITKMQVPSIKNLCNINNYCIFNKNPAFLQNAGFLFFYIFLIPTEPSTHVHHELPEPMPAQYRQFLKDPK